MQTELVLGLMGKLGRAWVGASVVAWVHGVVHGDDVVGELRSFLDKSLLVKDVFLILRDCLTYQCDLRQTYTNHALCSKCEHEY